MCPDPIAVRGGVVAVVAEGARVGPEHRAGPGGQVHHGATRLQHRERLRARHPPTGVAGELSQRWRDRPHRAEVGAGADHHADPGGTQSAHRRLEVGRRLTGAAQPDRVVGADQDHRHVGALAEQRPGHLGGQVRRPGPGDAHAGEQHLALATGRAARPLGEQPGELAADRVVDPVHADAERGRVAEQDQAQRRRAVPPDGRAQGQAQLGLRVPSGAGQEGLTDEQRDAAGRPREERDRGAPDEPGRHAAAATAGGHLQVRHVRSSALGAVATPDIGVTGSPSVSPERG